MGDRGETSEEGRKKKRRERRRSALAKTFFLVSPSPSSGERAGQELRFSYFYASEFRILRGFEVWGDRNEGSGRAREPAHERKEKTPRRLTPTRASPPSTKKKKKKLFSGASFFFHSFTSPEERKQKKETRESPSPLPLSKTPAKHALLPRAVGAAVPRGIR